MMDPSVGTRRRTTATSSPSSARFSDSDVDDRQPFTFHPQNSFYTIAESKRTVLFVGSVLTFLAFLTRFYKINNPDEVVFDEVHFGKFAAYYIRGEYYFDVHPPLAKLLLGAAGWFSGFDGGFQFENIGDSYTENHVPYIGMRALPATLGSLTVPLVYAIMKESGYSTVIAAFSALLILLDNAHIAQSRLILLDAQLVFFTALTTYSYIRFKKQRYNAFLGEWWLWLLITGICLGCTLGSKINGILIFLTVGLAVLVDLWDILDIRKGYTMEYFARHFFARVIGLIIVPFIVYLMAFWVHFISLPLSGAGDTFMSPAFQETLLGNEMLLNSHEVRYYDVITLKHKETKVFLHSHRETYPLKYDDGRISSQGQQVTGYGHDDTNNYWQIIPSKALPATGPGRIVHNGDVIQLLHFNTESFLLTHDVASPLMPTNQEFTTFPKDDNSRYNDTLFQLNIFDGYDDQELKTKSGYSQLIHVPTRVSMWTHRQQLPEWAFNQQEINGNKNVQEKTAVWYIDTLVSGDDEQEFQRRTAPVVIKEPKKMNFFRKYVELQLLMLQHNAGLTSSHPYASSPINWPFLISGISFWTDSETQRQIYLIGNVVSWWTSTISISIFVGVVGADLLARRRGIHPIPDPVRNRLWNNVGLFLMGWATHYLPFFLFSRQLFIHHYLPAHLFSALIAGAVLNFIMSETINYPNSVRGRTTRLRPAQYSDIGAKALAVTLIFAVALLIMFVFLAPLTYGTPGLDGDQVNSRRLLHTWTLHFAAKKTDYTI